MVDLRGKTALITGSSRGIGRGCALEMARCGANIIVTYRTHPDEAQEVAQKIRCLGQKSLVFQLDVADRANIDEVVDKGWEVFGALDILVSNAATSVRKPFLEVDLAEAKQSLDVTLWGFFNSAQSFARKLVGHGKPGKILFISSVHAFLPYTNAIAYNAAKAGGNHMAYSMASELAPYRINVNVIEPGWTDTPGERRWYSDEQLRQQGNRLPWGRLATIEDLGKAAAFLASDDAEYITGACLRVDGGLWTK